MKKEARKSAKLILAGRNISPVEIEELKSQIRSRKRAESKEKLKVKNNEYGLIDYLIDWYIFS